MAPRAHHLRRRDFLTALGSLTLSAANPPAPWFEELPPATTGLRWTHDNARSPQHYLPETMGPGVAFLDYDNDGWMDIFLVNGGDCDFYRPTTNKPRNALYRNNRNGTFTDVTAQAGLAGGSSFGMGVAAADYNNDGHTDLFVTAYGRSTLYRNNGNGTFTDVTAQAGLSISGWTTSAVWFDYDGDGLLDLFVCGFVDYRRDTQRLCQEARGGQPGYCIPRMFKPTPSMLFRNNGDGTFRDVSRETGIASRLGKALGVVATDIDNDGRLDLFVANDTVENFLFMNRGRRFEDLAIASMVGLGTDGMARSGMGVDSADLDGDGWQDLIVANIDRERFSVYRNTHYGMFDDLSFAGEIGRATYYMSGWGLKFFDFDNDGVMDLIVANGHPDDLVSGRDPRVRYREPLLLFRQDRRELRNVSPQAGPAFNRDLAARGLAVGDYNNDGAVDVLIGINGGTPLLLKNNVGRDQNWLGVHLRGVKSNRDAIGARVVWQPEGGPKRSRLITGGGSYLSAHDPRLVLGLASARRAEWVEVHWPQPSQRAERFVGLKSGAYTSITEGEGEQVGS